MQQPILPISGGVIDTECPASNQRSSLFCAHSLSRPNMTARPPWPCASSIYTYSNLLCMSPAHPFSLQAARSFSSSCNLAVDYSGWCLSSDEFSSQTIIVIACFSFAYSSVLRFHIRQHLPCCAPSQQSSLRILHICHYEALNHLFSYLPTVAE